MNYLVLVNFSNICFLDPHFTQNWVPIKIYLRSPFNVGAVGPEGGDEKAGGKSYSSSMRIVQVFLKNFSPPLVYWIRPPPPCTRSRCPWGRGPPTAQKGSSWLVMISSFLSDVFSIRMIALKHNQCKMAALHPCHSNKNDLLLLSSGVYIPLPRSGIAVTMQVPLLCSGVTFSPSHTSPIALKLYQEIGDG